MSNDVNEQPLNVYQQLKTNANAVIREIKQYDAAACDAQRYIAMRTAYAATTSPSRAS